MRVLLVDNNLSNCLVARSILSREGAAVRVAESGEIAIEMAQATRYDAVLLDIVMPGMDGEDTLRHLLDLTSADPSRNRPFLFALTAYDDQEDLDHYLKIGFDGVIAKPLRPGDLQRAIDIVVADGTPTLNLRGWGRSAAAQRPLLDQTSIENGPGLADSETRDLILSKYRQGLADALKDLSRALPGCLEGNELEHMRFRKALHDLRSASLTVGLDRAPHLAGRVRDLPRHGLIEGVAELLYAVRESLPALDRALRSDRSIAAREQAVIVKMR